MDRALLAAIASPRRREILRLLWHGERTVGDLHGAMPDVTLGAISLQLKTLAAAPLRKFCVVATSHAVGFPAAVPVHFSELLEPT